MIVPGGQVVISSLGHLFFRWEETDTGKLLGRRSRASDESGNDNQTR